MEYDVGYHIGGNVACRVFDVRYNSDHSEGIRQSNHTHGRVTQAQSHGDLKTTSLGYRH